MFDTLTWNDEWDNEDVKIMSFDIFDTLLIRRLNDPSSIFDIIENYYGFKGFSKLRVESENEARRQASLSGFEDTTLDDIYEIISENGDAYVRAKVIELELEKEFINRNPDFIDILLEAKKKNKVIIAVSDMYLPKEFIAELLSENDIFVDHLYVSSDVKKLKYSGNLFKHVLSDLSVKSENIIHFGDNWNADTGGSNKVGIKSIHYPKLKIQGTISPLLPHNFISKSNENVLTSIMIGGLLERWIKDNKPTCKKSLPYWVGYGIVAPIAILYIQWLYKESKNNGIERLYFLRRDGQLWYELFKVIYPDFDCKLVYGNRKILQDSSLTSLLDAKELPENSFITYRISHGGGIEEVLNDLCFPELLKQSLMKFIDEGDWDKSEFKARCLLFMSAIKENNALWRDYSENKKDDLYKYYNELGVNVIDRDKIAFVDIGWRLSSLKSLSEVIGFTPKAFFMGISEGAYYHDNFQGFLFEYGKPESNYSIYTPEFIEVMETIFGGTESTAVSINKDGSTFSVLFDKSSLHEEYRQKYLKEIHSAVSDFAMEQSLFTKYSKLATKEMLIDTCLFMVRNLINHPDNSIYNSLSRLSFSSHAGRSENTSKLLSKVWNINASKSLPKPQERAVVEIGTDELVFNHYWSHWCIKNTKNHIPRIILKLISEYYISRDINIISDSGYFDEKFYFENYPEVKGANMSGVEHYVRYGVYEKRNPNSCFSTLNYLKKNEDVMREGLNPLVHYISYGKKEGRGC